MYEKILVPLDGSVLAERSLPYAEELAGRLDSGVILLYVSKLANDHPQQRKRINLNIRRFNTE
jgi:nucleotide-binding universal stress UspA family protein